ncbi:decarboxylating 6-phosphogluconate dehydrogenase [Candidatus Nomurabacteria bacterium]|uniref:Decarboxylating 6-phosphogluconate dehydrogenase n=1 Tax=candidate division WWE3 bacterium TaxID=2053526 RepID=A0A955DZH8_UNCKA|nr:decarboxylating 6-phosphogluconate dehydrogenase [candidate division WWE3 bacterium]MCB9823538.1 decarboxylating 6-phosphogluconate dehydrogenase [Candidatus Nomurabacteria bacterium]MCB9827333.1 decarboxylating 6-phosphogluconate dehydrogenase [Candidatus Nomurabacteria bacterium]HXK52489.1 decarboxylating 6-phosphogluconate dehydrogenase [bacterium]
MFRKTRIGYIGLGRMGYNMVLRLLEKKYEVVVYNKTSDKTLKATEAGALPSLSITEMVGRLKPPRTIWLMVPYTAVDEVLNELAPLLSKKDVVIDGGNSFYKNTVKRYENLKERGIAYIDAGVSGGPSGARNGTSIMVGGDAKVVKKLERLFKDLSVRDGYVYLGNSGAGHFVKMVHNGIEYGMMQAIAEGFDVLKHAPYTLQLREVMLAYKNGSVISSRLMDWLDEAFRKYGENLDAITGSASHSGEGKWTAETAKDMGLSTPALQEAIKVREKSQSNPSYQGKLISAMRGEFGQHPVFQENNKLE